MTDKMTFAGRTMPDDIREIVETLRRPAHITCRQQESLVTFLDAAFPKPVPQWELDAQYLESLPDCYERSREIAARIRESNRGK